MWQELQSPGWKDRPLHPNLHPCKDIITLSTTWASNIGCQISWLTENQSAKLLINNYFQSFFKQNHFSLTLGFGPYRCRAQWDRKLTGFSNDCWTIDLEELWTQTMLSGILSTKWSIHRSILNKIHSVVANRSFTSVLFVVFVTSVWCS